MHKQAFRGPSIWTDLGEEGLLFCVERLASTLVAGSLGTSKGRGRDLDHSRQVLVNSKEVKMIRDPSQCDMMLSLPTRFARPMSFLQLP